MNKLTGRLAVEFSVMLGRMEHAKLEAERLKKETENLKNQSEAYTRQLEEQLQRIANMNAEKVDFSAKKTVTVGIIDGDGIKQSMKLCVGKDALAIIIPHQAGILFGKLCLRFFIGNEGIVFLCEKGVSFIRLQVCSQGKEEVFFPDAVQIAESFYSASCIGGGNGNGKVVFPVGNENAVPAEAVDNGACKVV